MDKKAQRIQKLFESAESASRSQWEYINQKGFDFANDNQLSEAERQTLQEQGMPDFTINRITDLDFSNCSLNISSGPLIFCNSATSVGIKL